MFYVRTLIFLRPSVSLFSPPGIGDGYVADYDTKLSTTNSSTTSLSPPQEQPIFSPGMEFIRSFTLLFSFIFPLSFSHLISLSSRFVE